MTPDLLHVDPRAGSGPLLPLLQALHAPVASQTLEYGDFAWLGHGSQGQARVGVEYKTMRDALSCMTGGRFAGHQLPGLLNDYDYSYLLIEGIWRSNPETGILEEAIHHGWRRVTLGRQPFMARAFDNWLLSLMTQTPLRVICTDFQRASAERIKSMYFWWQERWEGHSSLHAIWTPPPAHAYVFKPNLTHRIAAQFKGVGWDRGGAIAAKFHKSPLDFALAVESELQEIPGIGEGIAGSIVRQWTGEEVD